MSTSFQLPDLLTLTGSFELHVNPWCHPVTVASEKWMLEILEPEEFATLPLMKMGLLASLCFPSCDAPQLRLLTDFLTLLLYSNFRVLYRNCDAQGSEVWPTSEGEELSAEDSEALSWSTLLASHPLLKQCVHFGSYEIMPSILFLALSHKSPVLQQNHLLSGKVNLPTLCVPTAPHYVKSRKIRLQAPSLAWTTMC